MSKPFDTIVVCDFEFEIADGELPNVLCMVAHVLNANLQHVRTIRIWRGEFGSSAAVRHWPGFPLRRLLGVSRDDLLHDLGLEIPRHVFDLHTAYLAASNLLLPYDPDEKRKRERKRLPDACRAYGIEGWEKHRQGADGTRTSAKAAGALRARGRPRLLRGRRSKSAELLGKC